MDLTINGRKKDENIEINVDQTDAERASGHRNEGDLRQLNLSNNYLFVKVMEDRELCRRVLEKILRMPIRSVSFVNTEESVRTLPAGKGICMDVYVNDAEGTVYNVEMQTGTSDNLPKRARYYQGTLDLDQLPAGDNYELLRRTYIIFICTFPLFDANLHLYTFVNTCEENPSIRLGNETTKIFLSTCGKLNDIDEDLSEFLKYVEHSTDETAENSGSQLVRDIHSRVRDIKDTRRYQVEYMNLYMYEKEIERKATERGLAKGLEQGLEQGLKQGRSDQCREDVGRMADYLQKINPNLSRVEAVAQAESVLKP